MELTARRKDIIKNITIIFLIIMLVLGYLGSTELLTPTNILLYQLVWAVPGMLVTEWTRVV